MEGNKKNTKLIIHCDDIGSGFGANAAVKDLLNRGIVKSGSIMVPCPWAYEFVRWSLDNPGHDIGIHFTLNSEWETYRWAPVSGRSAVRSLCDKDGFFYRQHVNTAEVGDVRTELRAQIETALQWGLKPTHLDIHMWMLRSREDYYQVYIDLSLEYGIPPLLVKGASPIDGTVAEKFGLPIFDGVQGARSGATYDDFCRKASDQLKSLKEGTYYYIIHPSLATPDMPSIMPMWQEREWNYRFFMEDSTEHLLDELGIQIVTWAELSKL